MKTLSCDLDTDVVIQSSISESHGKPWINGNLALSNQAKIELLKVDKRWSV